MPRYRAGAVTLELLPSGRNARNSEATFVTLKSGRIMLVWSKFNRGNSGDFGGAILALRYSDDGGRTWSRRDQVVIDQEGTTNVMSPSLLRMQDGRIALLYLRKDGGDRLCIPYIRFSDDEMKTFSPPVCTIYEPAYYVVNNDRLIQLRSGRLVAPCSIFRYRGPSAIEVHPDLPGDGTTQVDQQREAFIASPGIIFMIFSDDGGATWLESLTSFYHCLPSGHGLEEPGAVELEDQRLWCFTRTGMLGVGGVGSRQYSSFSDDGGQVWSRPEPADFISPCSPMQVKRIPATGDLLAVWNDQSGRYRLPRAQDSSWGRTPLGCAISCDQGRTWEQHRLLEKDPATGYCYPALHFTDDAVLLSYNFGGTDGIANPLCAQRVRRIPLKDLYR